MSRSKQYATIAKLVTKTKSYPPAEAIALVKQMGRTSFDGSVEIHIRLGIDASKSDQSVRGTVVLPAGTGKTKKIVAFVSDAKATEAKDAGADVVGGEELIKEIKETGKIDFEVAVATPDMMAKLAPIAKTLGPKGLMPSPKNETITTDLAKTIAELKGGKITFKNDDGANLHQIIGKVSFAPEKLLENFTALIGAVRKSRPASAKGTFLKSVTMNATMGPSVRVEIPA